MRASLTNRHRDTTFPRSGPAAATLLALALCTGCGLKGDLYLPEQPPPEVTAENDPEDDLDDDR